MDEVVPEKGTGPKDDLKNQAARKEEKGQRSRFKS